MSHWMLYNLQTNKLLDSQTLTSVANGIHILFVHGRYIGRHQMSRTVHEELLGIAQRLLPSYNRNVPVGKISHMQETSSAQNLLVSMSVIDCDLDLINENACEIIIAFFAQLRDAYTQQNSRFANEPLILLLPFWAWDILHDRRLMSVVDYQEYLCWHDSNLLNPEFARQTEYFFRGAGFHAHNEQLHLPLPTEFRDFRLALQWLQRQEQGLARLGENGHAIVEPCEPDMNYIRTLTSFLPPFWLDEGSYKGWTLANPGNWGGPQEWKDISALDMHTRHLLLDGWLSLWPDIGSSAKIWLQPASLSLLYWAASHTGQPHTETPQLFLQNYQWDGARWFGGRWPKILAEDTAQESQQLEQTPELLASGKRLIKLFVSYAHSNNTNGKVDEFIFKLEGYLNASKNYHYKLWNDQHILIGENWHERIQEALKQCDFGLLLLSVSFLNRTYINEHELPALLQENKALPIGFEQFTPSLLDLRGLEANQIFSNKGKYYDVCSGKAKNSFIEKLFEQIEKRIDVMLSDT